MGTALGDLAAYTFKLGFLSAGIVFAVLFALPGLAYYWLGVDPILAFWAAYVMTRPLGASFADWTGKSTHAGGIGIGDGTMAFVLAALIVAGVTYLTITRADQIEPADRVGFEPALADEPA